MIIYLIKNLIFGNKEQKKYISNLFKKYNVVMLKTNDIINIKNHIVKIGKNHG